jgi:glycosyltransferase involved in cell wall biosynthesis
MPVWLNAANLLIQTSWREGSPNVIKEAIACNTPVVATPAGDTEDLLEGIQHAYVCSWDAPELAKRIHGILKDSGRSDGRQKRPDLDDRIVAQQIIKLYHAVLNKKRQ